MKKWIWIGLAVVAVAVIVYFMYKRKQSNDADEMVSTLRSDGTAMGVSRLQELEDKVQNDIRLTSEELNDLGNLRTEYGTVTGAQSRRGA